MSKLTLIIFAVYTLVSPEVFGQCNSIVQPVNLCESKTGEGFHLLKIFKIEKTMNDYIEYSYVFTKDTDYDIELCADEKNTGPLKVELFDSKRFKRAVKSMGIGSSFTYSCNKTDIYYLRFGFNDTASFCGISTLGFKKASKTICCLKG